jgi:hypothetical protein
MNPTKTKICKNEQDPSYKNNNYMDRWTIIIGHGWSGTKGKIL